METDKKQIILTKKDLKHFLNVESYMYCNAHKGRLFAYIDSLLSTPECDQYYLWRYVRTLRFCEFYLNNSYRYKRSILSIFYSLKYYLSLRKLRHYSYKTGIQISVNTFDIGLQIFHFGSIIVNENAKVGKNATILPGVVIGQKDGRVPIIGDNCYIGAGCKILGGIVIGDNVIIAPNAVVVKDVPANSIVAGVPAKVIKQKVNSNRYS